MIFKIFVLFSLVTHRQIRIDTIFKTIATVNVCKLNFRVPNGNDTGQQSPPLRVLANRTRLLVILLTYQQRGGPASYPTRFKSLVGQTNNKFCPSSLQFTVRFPSYRRFRWVTRVKPSAHVWSIRCLIRFLHRTRSQTKPTQKSTIPSLSVRLPQS